VVERRFDEDGFEIVRDEEDDFVNIGFEEGESEQSSFEEDGDGGDGLLVCATQFPQWKSVAGSQCDRA